MIAAVLAAFVCVFMLVPMTVNAADEPSTAHLYGTHKIENGSIKTGKFTFVLTAKDDKSPMPSGSTGKEKKVTISPGETFDFGTISFAKPGIYEYKISREIIKSKDLKQDDSVYDVKIAHFTDGATVIVYQKANAKGKEDKITYVDKYVKSGGDKDKPTKSSKKSIRHKLTGDKDTLYKLGSIFAISALLGLLLFSTRRRKK